MPKYIIKRVLIGLVTLFVLASVTFFPMKATPGSLFSLAKHKMSEVLAAIEARHNLDKSLVKQYVIYLKGAAQGNLEESMINTGRSVSCYIKTDFPVTAHLGLIAFVLALVGGTALGTGAALSRHKRMNNLRMFVATAGISIPPFLIAMIVLIIFGVQLHVLPFIGLNSPLNYIMSVLSLALYPIIMIARLTRSNILEVINQDYITLARSKGMSYKRVVIRRALKNTMLPVATYAGPIFIFMLTRSFVIENVFSVPGIGSAFVSYITTRDYPITMGLTIFLGFLATTFSPVADILFAIIDPRIKLDQGVEATSDGPLQEELNDDLFERLDDSERNVEKIAYESQAYLMDAWYRFRQSKLAFVGLCSLMFMLLCVAIISMISPYTYDGQSLELRNIGPSFQYLMGTDKFGCDILARIMQGGRASSSVDFAAALISLGVGVLCGGIAGYLGGEIDMAMIRFVDMMYLTPNMSCVIMIVVIMGPSISPILIGICVSS